MRFGEGRSTGGVRMRRGDGPLRRSHRSGSRSDGRGQLLRRMKVHGGRSVAGRRRLLLGAGSGHVERRENAGTRRRGRRGSEILLTLEKCVGRLAIDGLGGVQAHL